MWRPERVRAIVARRRGARRSIESAGRSRSRLFRLPLVSAAVAQDRLRLLTDGRVVLTLKTAWADGTRQLIFEPLTLLEKLAALTPRPRTNLVLYHGVLAACRLASARGRLRRPAG